MYLTMHLSGGGVSSRRCRFPPTWPWVRATETRHLSRCVSEPYGSFLHPESTPSRVKSVFG